MYTMHYTLYKNVTDTIRKFIRIASTQAILQAMESDMMARAGYAMTTTTTASTRWFYIS